MDFRILCCVGSLLLMTNPTLSSEIKKWVDQDGQVHFGRRAPYGTNAIQVEPEIITTTPPSNNSLKDIMRPGELRMIKNYDKRGKRLIKAKRKSLKQEKLNKKRTANAKKKCKYYKGKIDNLKRKLRQGYTPVEKDKIEDKIASNNLKVEEYCN